MGIRQSSAHANGAVFTRMCLLLLLPLLLLLLLLQRSAS
jgi:hypothetical protein